MATNNAVNTSLSGQSGTGSFAGTTSPTFVTPTLGAALATSINFGGSSLANYVSGGTWTPTFTFLTPGDLSVSYSTRVGTYTRIGSVLIINCNLVFTPTFTTSSGILFITGVPNNIAADSYGTCIIPSITYPVGTAYLVSQATIGNAYINILANGSATSSVNLSTSNFVSGVQRTIIISMAILI